MEFVFINHHLDSKDVFSFTEINLKWFIIQFLNLHFLSAKDVLNHFSFWDVPYFIKLLEQAFLLLIFSLFMFILLDFALLFFLFYFLIFNFKYLKYFYFLNLLYLNAENFMFHVNSICYFIFIGFLLLMCFFCLNLLDLILWGDCVLKNFLFLHIKLREKKSIKIIKNLRSRSEFSATD